MGIQSLQVLLLLSVLYTVSSLPILKGKIVTESEDIDTFGSGLETIAVVPVAPVAIATAAGNAVLSGKSPGAFLTAKGILPPPPNAIGAPSISGPVSSVLTPENAKLLSGLSILSLGPLPIVGASTKI